MNQKDIVTVLFMCQSPQIREQLIGELQACFGDRIKVVNRIGQGRRNGSYRDYAFSIEVMPNIAGAEMLLLPATNQKMN